MPEGSVRASRCLGFGMVGFGLGGAVTSLLGDAMMLGFALQGALGGGALGLATRSVRQALGIAGLAAMAGFVGHFAAFFIVLTIWEPPWPTLFIGSVSGAVLGATLGAWSAGPIGLPIGGAAGAVGLGAGFLVALGRIGGGPSAWSAWLGPDLSTSWGIGLARGALEGIMGGGLLGLAWTYCERRASATPAGAHAPLPLSPDRTAPTTSSAPRRTAP